MSVPGGHRNRGCEDRFYSPPAMRRQQQQQQQQQRKSAQLSRVKSKSSVESEKRIDSTDDCASTATTTTSSFSSPRIENNSSSNLDMFMEHTTPIVTAQYFPKVLYNSIQEYPFFMMLRKLGKMKKKVEIVAIFIC